ncbi:MAG TPA: ThuA domain-containing protein, partial [Thermoguttaceae bacterium]|nr:ThuA domain-containing protein [Thermoguttaceae bacterium]
AATEDTATVKKKIVLIAGRKSHGYGGHEHNAGCLLLSKWLEASGLGIEAAVYQSGWPEDPKALDGADAIVMFCDGGGGHVVMPHLEEVDALAKKGVGIACLHYGVEIPKGEPGDYLKDWIGGYFETDWSVNPHWTAEFKELPEHPVTSGVKPFWMSDEWYYHMRFVDDMEGVTPILTATPPDSTRERPDGAHSNNPTVRSRKGMPEHVAWVRVRPNGGRGFGFTGLHWHWSWADDDFRTIVLNGIAWTAGVEIPADGVPSTAPTLEELKANQDYPVPGNYDFEAVSKLIEQWKTLSAPPAE